MELWLPLVSAVIPGIKQFIASVLHYNILYLLYTGIEQQEPGRSQTQTQPED
jgi:hypothetical protein